MRSAGAALVESLIVIPLWLSAFGVVAAFAITGQDTQDVLDQLHTRVWTAESPHSQRLKQGLALAPAEAGFPKVIEKSAPGLNDDGYRPTNPEFLQAVYADGWIAEETALKVSQAVVELIRRLGAPAPFSETRASAITSVGVVGDLHMPLPRRIRPDA